MAISPSTSGGIRGGSSGRAAVSCDSDCPDVPGTLPCATLVFVGVSVIAELSSPNGFAGDAEAASVFFASG